MSVAEKIQSGLPFWAGEDILNEYRFFPSEQSPGGYITSNGVFHSDVKIFADEGMQVVIKFFGEWQVSIIKYTSIAFSTADIVQRIQAQAPKPTPKRVIKTGPADYAELRDLVKYMDKICDQVPRGLSSLKDALTFATLDLGMYNRFGKKSKSYDAALAFGRSIPHFDDFDSEECAGWMLHDEEHLKYMP